MKKTFCKSLIKSTLTAEEIFGVVRARRPTKSFAIVLAATVALFVCSPANAQDQADARERTALTVNGVNATITRQAVSRGGPAGPTTSFSEFDTEITIETENTSGAYRRMEFDIRAIDAPGYKSGASIYERLGGFGLSPGQKGTMTLGMGDTLSPGRFRVVVIAEGSRRSLPIEVSSQHPLARPLDATDEAALGPNLALAALGAEISVSSSWNDSPMGHRLIDGFDWIRDPTRDGQCLNCGWATRQGDRRPTITVDLAGDRPVDIATIVVDTRKFWPRGRNWEWVTGWLPKNVAVSVSETGQPGDFRAVTTARLQRDLLRQAIRIPDDTMAKSVRLQVLENVSGGTEAAFVELEVREAPDTQSSILPELELDIARPELGGAVVRYSGFSEQWTAARLFDGLPTAWVSRDNYFPQDFTIAFNADRRAFVDRVELVMDDEVEYSSQWPSEVAVSISDHPLIDFEEVTRTSIGQRSGLHAVPVGREARFLKVRLLDNHGDQVTNLGEIRVIEGPEAPSVLANEQTRTIAGTEANGVSAAVADIREEEPNDTADQANALHLGQTLEGAIDPLGELDFFALPDLDPDTSALTLTYSGRPYIRHGLSLLNEAGEVLSHFDPGDLPAADARLSFKLTGEESHLRLSEPPASVVVIWDTSGSMQGNEADLERAVRQYIAAAPDSQLIRMIRFSNDVELLGPAFSSYKPTLYSYLGGKFGPNGGTSLYDAVLRGLELLKDRIGNRAIVVMTDGNDNSPTWLGDVWAGLERNRVRLYTIGLGDGLQEYSYVLASTGERLLGHLAQGTNGRSFFATDSAALNDFYEQIATELAEPATYLLTPSQEIGEGILQIVAVGEQVPSAAMPAVHVIFDVSGSMSERLPGGVPRIDAAKTAMYDMLDGLPDGAPFGLTVYGARIPERPDKDLACTDIVTIQDLAPLDKASIGQFIRDLRPRGGTTPLARSIEHVVRNFRGENGGIIVAITDGIEECDPDPLVTVGQLNAHGLDQIELNVIGFDLRDDASRSMMEQIAEAGGGKYFDASNGEAVAAALKTAIAASYEAVDAAGETAARGKIDGPPQTLPPGWYTIEIAAADGALRTNDVRVDAEKLTSLEANKVGNEMDVTTLDPRDYDPLVECGRAAERRGDAGRVERIQMILNERGFDVGTPDGQVGPNTRRGMAAFAEAQDIEIDPEPTLVFEQHLDCVASNGTPYGG